MTRYKQVNGELIPFTPEEEAARDAEEAAVAAAAPMKAWEAEMAALDITPMEASRAIEDIFDALPASQQSAVSQTVRDRIAARKIKRGQRPS